MNFFDYIGVSEDDFVEKYINTGLVNSQKHPTLPLVIFCYGRKAVHENVWDGVTSKCRGIVVDIETDEVIARPFEKFHNYGSTVVEGLTPEGNPRIFAVQPVIWEKMDGFMVTGFFYRGEWHAASKASFTSIHAKWATKELRRKMEDHTTTGTTTLLFEGLHESLRIVIDYKDRPNQLVLLAVIDNETGAELLPDQLREYSKVCDFDVPDQYVKTWQEAHADTGVMNTTMASDEGYVLTWYSKVVPAPPFRLKMKYIDYLRLHRMVTGVSPKRVWEVLATSQTTELDDYLNNSTPRFSKFVTKWVKALKFAYEELESGAKARYDVVKETVRVKVGQLPYENLGAERKAWALEFQRDENKKFASILFAKLDNKDIRPVIWKQVKHMTAGVNPMVDSHSL